MKGLLSEFEPTPEKLREIYRRRALRMYQRKSRGGKRSACDEAENAAIVAAWEAGEITEGQAMRALGVSRVEAREIKLTQIALGRALALQ